MRVRVRQVVNFLAVFFRAEFADAMRDESQINALVLRHLGQRAQVLMAFVARFVRHNQLAARILQGCYHGDRMLDALSRNDPRRLQDEKSSP